MITGYLYAFRDDYTKPVGEYIVEIKNEYYVGVSKSITIRDGQESTVSGSLKATPIGRVFIEANRGNYDTQMDLAYCYFYGPDQFIKDGKSKSSMLGELPPELSDYYDAFAELKKDKKKAWEWAVKASENVTHEFYEAYYNLSAFEFLMEMYLLSHDYEWSFKYAEKAYSSEHKYKRNLNQMYDSDKCASNSFWLAWHYYYGKGTQKNYNLAVKYIDEFRRYHRYSPEGSCSESTLTDFGKFWFSKIFEAVEDN